MPTQMPEPVARYVAASNNHDVRGMEACFAPEAEVMDENVPRKGIAAIREWIQEADAKYKPRLEVVAVRTSGGETVLEANVSGDFPGSPVLLRFAFVLRGGLIVRLEITA